MQPIWAVGLVQSSYCVYLLCVLMCAKYPVYALKIIVGAMWFSRVFLCHSLSLCAPFFGLARLVSPLLFTLFFLSCFLLQNRTYISVLQLPSVRSTVRQVYGAVVESGKWGAYIYIHQHCAVNSRIRHSGHHCICQQGHP